MEELALSLIGCSIRESRHGTLPGQHTRVDRVGRDTGA